MRDTSSTITVANRIEELSRIYELIERFAEDCGLPEPTRRALLLVVEELFANIVGHGYDGDRTDAIVITLERVGEEISLVLLDHAVPFDVSRTPERPREDQELGEMPVGGLGLFLVHEFARSVTNRREDDANVTEVRLPVAVESGEVPRI
jgi:serine/threonine-protein kinase RsbW